MIRVLLIGGTSNAGKSTVGKAVAENLGWRLESTDYLARHPGRPWRTDGSEVPPHVIQHFSTLSIDELMAQVLRHYRSVWPQIEALMTEASEGIVIEGSAVLPDLAAGLLSDQVRGVWLIGEEGIFTGRIEAESRKDLANDAVRTAIDKFVLRAERFNEYIKTETERLGLISISVHSSTEILADQIIAHLK